MKIHEVYMEEMRSHSFGYAPYYPERAGSLNPGACGYFNALGDWTLIIDLIDSEALKEAGYIAFSKGLQKAPTRLPEE